MLESYSIVNIERLGHNFYTHFIKMLQYFVGRNTKSDVNFFLLYWGASEVSEGETQ